MTVSSAIFGWICPVTILSALSIIGGKNLSLTLSLKCVLSFSGGTDFNTASTTIWLQSKTHWHNDPSFLGSLTLTRMLWFFGWPPKNRSFCVIYSRRLFFNVISMLSVLPITTSFWFWEKLQLCTVLNNSCIYFNKSSVLFSCIKWLGNTFPKHTLSTLSMSPLCHRSTRTLAGGSGRRMEA